MRFAALLSLAFIYLIMGFLFESFVLPLSILVTIPLASYGVAWIHWAAGRSPDPLGMVGMIILMGVVVNNGIVLIDHINGLRVKGAELKEAVIEGCVHRLRPIVITSLTTVLAVTPLAIGLGQGDDLAQPMAVVTFGGMFVSTLLTLLVIPLMYFRLAKYQKARKAV